MAARACADARRHIAALVDEDLDAGDAQVLRAHLAGCVSCRDELAMAARVRTALRCLPEAPLPPGFAAGLERRLRVVAPARAQGRWRGLALPLLSAMAGFVVAAAVAAPWLRPAPPAAAARRPSRVVAGSLRAGPAERRPAPRVAAVAGARRRAVLGGVPQALRPAFAATAATAATAAMGTTGASAATGATGATSLASSPAVALTVLTSDASPVLDAARLAVSASGGTLAETLEPSDVPAPGGPRVVATLDADVPSRSVGGLVGSLKDHAALLAEVGESGLVTAASDRASVLVTVLVAPPVRVTRGAAGAGVTGGVAATLTNLGRVVLVGAARVAPWAAVALAVALGVWGAGSAVVAWRRR